MSKIKVLIIDDSALIRQVLTKILNSAHDIEVVGVAADPYIARNKIKRFNPDVLTLDVEMPRMDGLAFLSHLMRLRPMPVVMVSVLTQKGADITLQALELGAVDFLAKPQIDIAQSFESYTEEIISKIRTAAGAKISPFLSKPQALFTVQPKYSADVIISKTENRRFRHFKTTERIIAIGASTGGTEAIKVLLMQMPANAPGIVISQHIPATFSYSFAMRMNQLSAMTVFEAENEQVILPGHVYIAPGGYHLLVERSGARYICRLNQGNPVNRHRPSVDVLFRSISQNVGPNAIGVILTGMGDDGARGITEMREAGAITIAQDEHTSVVWGMPGEAIKRGKIDYVLPLYEMADKLLSLTEESETYSTTTTRR
ncbi:MAG TPA: chemotaxis response regulator protein-glutamate methylesterase [Thiotrichaceae bacterium]|nr:chemotaxis response regulator protein-glutamate methylesterase [Thiotrichaceae bacterium]